MILFISREIKAEEYCAEGVFANGTNFIKIDQNIYLSTDGKLYRESDCESFIAKNKLETVASNYQAVKSEIDRMRDEYIGSWFRDHGSDYESSYNYQNRHQYMNFLNAKIREIEKNIPNIVSIFNFEDDSLQFVKPDNEINTNTIERNFSPHKYQPNKTIEISPTYYKKFIELEREPTLKELIGIKRYLLGEIDSKLREKYQENYIFIENNGTFLRSEIKLSREITNNKWEILELNMTPVIGNLKQIDIQVSAILKTQSGIGNKVPESKTFKFSKEQESLEKYVARLINFLKNEVPISDFNLKES